MPVSIAICSFETDEADGMMIPMNRIQRQRRRLQLLIDEFGGQKALAEKVATADSYISQLMTARNGIARKFCERLEEATGKPDGWMDQWLPEEAEPEYLRSMLEEMLNATDRHRKVSGTDDKHDGPTVRISERWPLDPN